MYLACKCNMAVNLRLHHEDEINTLYIFKNVTCFKSIFLLIK